MVIFGWDTVSGSDGGHKSGLLLDDRRRTQFRFGAGEVLGGVQGQGVVVGLSPLAKALFDSLGERMYNLASKFIVYLSD